MLLLCGCVHLAMAQRITHTFSDVSMSDALVWLQSQTERYDISFVYNELEDFRVSTEVKNQSVPDAIQQMIGFYPIRMTRNGERKLFVECTHKASRHVKGRLVDEQNLPVVYANIALLSPSDSTIGSAELKVLLGGVSNEDGFFIIPCEYRNVLARISYVGYKTLYLPCTPTDLGTIRMEPEVQMMQNVTVKGERPQFQMIKGGLNVNVAGSLLAEMGTANDVLGQLPRVDVSSNGAVSVFGKGAPLIYINNRKVRDMTELTRLKSSDIKSVDIITNPGAQYDASVQSVIRIHTVKPQDEGVSVSALANVRNNHQMGGYGDLEVKYRTKGLEIFAESYLRSAWLGEDNHVKNELLNEDDHILIAQDGDTRIRSKSHYEQLGFNYDINDRHSLGASYTFSGVQLKDGKILSEQHIWQNGVFEGEVFQDATTTRTQNPLHDFNTYYMGKVGKLDIDFNATFYRGKEQNLDVRNEISEELESRDVHTRSVRRNQMAAGKLVLTYPAWKGVVSAGSEITHTRTDGVYTNDEQYVRSSDTKIRESNVAGFAEYDLTLGAFKLGAGLRYEHVTTDYYSLGVWEAEPSRRYDDWFPNASVEWGKNKWNLQLNYSRKTSRPSYWELRNFIQYDNRYTYEGGNPLLRPQFTHNVALSALRSWFHLSVDYASIQHTRAWVPELYDGQNIVFLCSRNYGDMQTLSASVSASPKFGFYRPNFMVNFSKLFYDSAQYGSGLKEHKPTWTFVAKNTFVLSKTCSANANLRYRTDYYSEFQKAKGYFQMDLRLNQSFFNKTLLVNLYVTDLFRTSQERWTSYGIGANLYKDCYNYDQTFGVIVTYNFNATRSKYKGTGAGNAEKSRL